MKRRYRIRRFFLLLICTAFLGLCYYVVFNTELFIVKDIMLEGNINITSNELAFYMLDEEDHILKLSAYELNKRLLSYPKVKSGVVKKIYPNQLQITIEERMPVLVIQNKKFYLLCDEDKILLQSNPDKAVFDKQYNTFFYVLENLNLTRFASNYEIVSSNDNIIDDAITLVYYLDLYEMNDIRLVVENEELVLYLDTLKVIFSNGGDMVEKINKFYNLYNHLRLEDNLAGVAKIYKKDEPSFVPLEGSNNEN